MNSCEHITWVQVSGLEDITLHDEGRMRRILTHLVNPKTQRPSLLLFLGHRAKNIALRELFPYNNIRRGRSDGLANLRVDTATLSSDYPILFADSNPTFAPAPNAATPVCHETKSYPFHSQNRLDVSLFDLLHARFFCLFSDVICIFADDFANLDCVVERLKTWAAAGSAYNHFCQVRPRVIVVVKGDDVSPTYNLLQAQDLRFNLHQQDLISFFSSITVLHLADIQISPLARHRRLKEVLLRHADEMRQLRQSLHCLYSAIHLNHFFEEAIRHVAVESHLPFNFLLTSRRHNMVSQDFCEHLTNYLQISEEFIDNEEALLILASSILMDAYPPGMHAFDPALVYDIIYKPYYLKALSHFHEGIESIERRSQHLRRAIISTFAEMIELDLRSYAFHLQLLRKTPVRWELIKSNRTCLSCLRRVPENVLSCGHALCDICVRVFGVSVPGFEYRYKLGECTICGLGTMTKTLKPPTAGARILSIDGGGVRGVVPLEFLGMLQSAVGPVCPIQDLFDLAFGTSSGGLIVLGLFLHHWGVSQCVQTFDALAKQCFEKRERGSHNLFRRVRNALKCWVSDECYEAGELEAALRLQFGDHQKVFDYTHCLANTKVAVTGTLVEDVSPVLFSNYNGAGIRTADCGYKHFRPQKREEEVCVWEAGRATSAAPPLFRPLETAGVGLVQDGGLAHNNPARLAIWECRQIWPQHKGPDVVVSLGTGTSDGRGSQSDSRLHNIWYNGFVPRLWRSLMSFVDGQRAWVDFINGLDEKTRANYFRLNLVLPGKDIAMDDTASMEMLRSAVRMQPQGWEHCLEVATALLISSFFFEIKKGPKFTLGAYHCEGLIRCRLPGHVIFQALLNIKQATWVFVTDTEMLGHYTPSLDRCRSCSLYRKAVKLSVRHPSDPITIYMRDSKQQRRQISGMPATLQWFVTQQHLESDFGSPYHESADPHRKCCSGKRKDDGQGSPGTKPYKKARLLV